MQFYSREFIRQIVHKNIGGLITTPFWNYITIRGPPTPELPQTAGLQSIFVGIYGGMGVTWVKANPDKSFVTPVYKAVPKVRWKIAGS